ncbi:MAG: cytochrome-c peroxidase [Labilithrix sp.]|nr:cytochrome-c peroxidase [Labilithrix sp.]MCW5810210.1 cytochrome-c peroxidase [Labilithrix sp.]
MKQKVVVPENAPPSLKTVPVPQPSNLGDFVANEAAAIRLGKALFWEMQVGSDGVTACATCHFHAGADVRTKNQLSPGLLKAHTDGSSNPEITFQTPAPNHRFVVSDFPFHKLSDPDNRNSTVLFDTNDVAASQGVFSQKFQALIPGLPIDLVVTTPDADGFRVGNVNVRRVEPRNTPTVINAVFNHRQFWDGRAQPEFNGVNIWGARDPNAFVYKRASNGNLVKTTVSLPNSSLASQAVGPPLSSFEMTADGQTFQEIGDNFVGSILDKALSPALGLKLLRATGKKLVGGGLRPLDKQRVHPNDSVLGGLSRWPNKGLSTDYEAMIKAAFKPEWWNGNQYVRIESNGSRTIKNPGLGGILGVLFGANDYTQMEYNFSLFFGIAIQLYEATLVADDSPFDKFRDGDENALTEQEKEGVVLFSDTVRVRCINCHGGAEMTDASVAKATSLPLRRREGNILDRGFNNIGVRPTFEDLGLGNTDSVTGKPLANSRLAVLGELDDPTLVPPIGPDDVIGVDGSFKAPGLRNVALTGPYFHNGGQVSLRQVIEFYSRGGDFQPITGREGPISPLNTPNLTESEKEALVAFMRALTDDRVKYERAPFDHPELFVPDGHPGNESSVTNRGDGNATDSFLTIPAVGASGNGAALTSFLGQ